MSTGQAEYDAEKPKLDAEILQLNAELPVLQEVLGLVTSLSGAAAAKANHKAILKLAQEKVAGLVPPKADKRLDGTILKLKSILAEADTAGTAASMAAVIQGLQAQMTSRSLPPSLPPSLLPYFPPPLPPSLCVHLSLSLSHTLFLSLSWGARRVSGVHQAHDSGQEARAIDPALEGEREGQWLLH